MLLPVANLKNRMNRCSAGVRRRAVVYPFRSHGVSDGEALSWSHYLYRLAALDG